MKARAEVCVLLCFAHLLQIVGAISSPNIVFILADDLGWDDVGFHGSDILTPNIDRLARDGVILNNYYVQPCCSPTRAALLTGRYPIHSGLQHGVIPDSSPYGLPLNITLLPQTLKRLGYVTHMVGKWHLGFYKKEYTPTYRGFDSHLGYWTGYEDYYDHTAITDSYSGLDLRENMDVLRDRNGTYSTELFSAVVENIITSHDKSEPLFLYLAHQAVHSGNRGAKPLEAPQKYVDRFPFIENKQRRTFAGMAAALDDSVGNVTRALEATGLLNNTIIIFSTDNGGPANGVGENAACNRPLRGTKFTLWEGGVRGVGFIFSPLLNTSGYIYNNLMHVTDWLPTLYHVAGGNTSDISEVDGVNQWESLSSNGQAVRSELLHNIDPITGSSSMRYGDYKIIVGNMGGDNNGWYGCDPPNSKSQISERIYSKNSYGVFDHTQCGPKPTNASTNCAPHKSPCLFNIKQDPCEYLNIAQDRPDLIEFLMNRLTSYSKTALPPLNKPADPNSDPALHGGVWSPWMN